MINMISLWLVSKIRICVYLAPTVRTALHYIIIWWIISKTVVSSHSLMVDVQDYFNRQRQYQWPITTSIQQFITTVVPQSILRIHNNHTTSQDAPLLQHCQWTVPPQLDASLYHDARWHLNSLVLVGQDMAVNYLHNAMSTWIQATTTVRHYETKPQLLVFATGYKHTGKYKLARQMASTYRIVHHPIWFSFRILNTWITILKLHYYDPIHPLQKSIVSLTSNEYGIIDVETNTVYRQLHVTCATAVLHDDVTVDGVDLRYSWYGTMGIARASYRQNIQYRNNTIIRPVCSQVTCTIMTSIPQWYYHSSRTPPSH